MKTAEQKRQASRQGMRRLRAERRALAGRVRREDLRDRMAMLALAGLCARHRGPYVPLLLAEEAYKLADVMLEVRG